MWQFTQAHTASEGVPGLKPKHSAPGWFSTITPLTGEEEPCGGQQGRAPGRGEWCPGDSRGPVGKQCARQGQAGWKRAAEWFGEQQKVLGGLGSLRRSGTASVSPRHF